MVALLFLLFADPFQTSFQAGLIALNSNRLAEAQSQLETASRLQPQNPRPWLALAQTYWKLHQPAEARNAANNAGKFADDAAVLHGLAVFYTESENPRKASELLKAAIRRDPYQESFYFELAQLHLREQDFAAALEVLDAGRKNFDKSPQLELAAGVAYYGLRRFPEAMEAFLRVIQLDPGVEQPYVFLGRMLDQAEDRLPRITAVLAAYAARAPEDYRSSFLYGKALATGGSASDAERLLRKSISQNGAFWESHFELGVLLEQRGRVGEAAAEIRRAIELNPNDTASHYHLARLYDRLGKPDQARAERQVHARLLAAGGPR